MAQYGPDQLHEKISKLEGRTDEDLQRNWTLPDPPEDPPTTNR